MRAYVLIEPAQDYEESAMTLGVYGSYFEAEKAEAKNRKAAEAQLAIDQAEDDAYESEWDYSDARRIAVIQLWEGARRVKVWRTTRPVLVDGKATYKWEVEER